MSTYGDKSFPKQKLPFNKKGKKWRQAHLDWADKNSSFGNETTRQKLKDKKVSLDLYNGKIDMGDLKLVLNPGDIEKYFVPNKIQHYPIMAPRINVLIGEEKNRKFDWTAVITNPTTIAKIRKDKKQFLDQKLKEMLFDDGISEEEMEKQLQEYADYVNFDYQDIREKRANLLMKHYIRSLDMKMKFQQGFKDALIMGEEIYMVDIVNGEVKFEKLNPLTVYTLRSGYSNRIEDSDIIVIDEYWSPGRIQDHFYNDLKEADVKKLDDGEYGNYTTDSDGENLQIDDIAGYNVLDRESINAFLWATGTPSQGKQSYTDGKGNVRVLRMFWRSKKKIKKVTYFDEFGRTQIKYRSEDYIPDKEKGEMVEDFWITEWWKGAKIGQDIYLQIKPREIQYNKFNQPSFNSCGIVGQVYNTNEEVGVSLMDRGKALQYLYDVSWYRVNEALSKYMGSIVELDLAKVPKGWSVTKWLYFARKAGISIVDSFKEGQRGMAKGKLAGAVGNTTGKVLEQRVGDFIQTHIQMMEFAKAQIDEITGVTRQRLGQMENRETMGGIERAVSQSNHITEELYTLHDYCKKRCLQLLIETAKIALMGNTMKFHYIADDATRQLMEIDGDEFAEENYGIEVSNETDINRLHQKLERMVELGLQNQMISFSNAMKIYNSSSMREIQRLIEKDESKMEENRNKQAEADRKQLKEQQEKADALREQERTDKINKDVMDDETKRYIAELKDATDRLKIANEQSDLVKSEEDEKDDFEYEKFIKELGLKKEGLDNDMRKHKDNVRLKEKQIAAQKSKNLNTNNKK